MNYRKLENILLYILIVVTAGVYLYTVAPTFSFWDCGEFIASAYTLAVPHPPGTPLFVFLGRVWLMITGLFASILPISRDVGWQMNLLGLGFAVLSVLIIYRLLLKIFRLWQGDGNPISQLFVAFATAFAVAFFYTFWNNAVETEIYSASTFIFLLINYLVLLWYESMKNEHPKNNYLLLAFYLIFLASGVGLMPFLIFLPVYLFIFIVEWRYRRDWLLILLGVFQLLFFPFLFLLPQQYNTVLLVLFGLILLAGIVLPLNNPRRFSNWRFFWTGVLLVIFGISSELYLPIRSRKLLELYQNKEATVQYLAGKNVAPRINECAPGENFSAFYNVLHRSQYGPQYLVPRKTQEETGFSVLEGYFWQVALFVRYLSQQVAPEGMNRFLRGLLLTIFYAAALWGMVELFRREKKLFLLMMMIMFMLVFAMIGYLNLRFSPSDSNSKHQPQEVRERDYFYHTSYTYVGLLLGLGMYGIMECLRRYVKGNRTINMSMLVIIILFSVVPLLANFQLNNRFGNFIPKDYGYNMLVSCDDEAVVFTNGDNDTFPLWYVQEILGFKRKVIVANLSLINTPWYIKQLKYWGTPINFKDKDIDRCDGWVRMTPDRRVIYVKDIMIRHIIAVNAGIRLTEADYYSPQEEFASKYLKGYKGKRPIYFASTVSPENYKGFVPYVRLEGLVYRVVGDSVSFPSPDLKYAPYVNTVKTSAFFYDIYRYTGTFEPQKQKVLASILVNFDKRRNDGEFTDRAVIKDENTERLYSNYTAGLYYLGVVLQSNGDLMGTISAWKFALLFESLRDFTINFNLGYLYAQIGMVDSAEVYFSKIDTRDPQVLTKIGMIYRSVGRFDRAVKYFQRVISVNPRNPQGYMGLLAIYLDNNDSISTRRVLQDWLRINPGDTSAINMLKELDNP